MTRRLLLLFMTAAPIAFSPAAFAQSAPEDPQPTVPDPIPPEDPAPTGEPTFMMTDRTYTTTTTTERPMMIEEWGFALSAGGGVSGFTNETARDATRDGGGWDVRATIGTRMPVAGEIAYIGSAQTIDALGLDDDAVLIGNGVQANVRLNVMTDTAVQPFIFAGAAWRRYDLANTNTNTSDVSDSDNVVEFPVGAGLSYRYRGFILDARGEFRAATDEDLMPTLGTSPGSIGNNNQASLHRWGVNANLGVEF